MAYSLTNHAHSYSNYQPALKHSWSLTRFFQWAAKEDEAHHIAWVGASIMSMAGVFFPATMAVVMFNGASFAMVIAAMASFVMVVVTNLAALPTKYTIPLFFLAVLVDLAVIATSFFLR